LGSCEILEVVNVEPLSDNVENLHALSAANEMIEKIVESQSAKIRALG
jgi:hypothetical protein